MRLNVNMVGRSYDATAPLLPDCLELSEPARLHDALEQLARLLPAGRELPASCLVVHNGTHLGTLSTHEDAALADNDELVLIAPVAGG